MLRFDLCFFALSVCWLYFEEHQLGSKYNFGEIMHIQQHRHQVTALNSHCGVKPDTFAKVCECVRDERTRVQKKSGRPCEPSVEDQVLLTFEYWREYPPMFHLARARAVVGSDCFAHD